MGFGCLSGSVRGLLGALGRAAPQRAGQAPPLNPSCTIFRVIGAIWAVRGDSQRPSHIRRGRAPWGRTHPISRYSGPRPLRVLWVGGCGTGRRTVASRAPGARLGSRGPPRGRGGQEIERSAPPHGLLGSRPLFLSALGLGRLRTYGARAWPGMSPVENEVFPVGGEA